VPAIAAEAPWAGAALRQTTAWRPSSAAVRRQRRRAAATSATMPAPSVATGAPQRVKPEIRVAAHPAVGRGRRAVAARAAAQLRRHAVLGVVRFFLYRCFYQLRPLCS
jgi:hypothetical protein